MQVESTVSLSVRKAILEIYLGWKEENIQNPAWKAVLGNPTLIADSIGQYESWAHNS